MNPKSLIKIFLITCMFMIGISCNQKNIELSHKDIVVEYIKGLNESDFSSFSDFLNDSIVSMEGDITISKTKTDLYTIFQWDSVFSPEYRLIDTIENPNNIEVIISKECHRIRFLHDSSTIYRSIFEFEDNKISKITTVENIIFDTSKWQVRRDSLVNWIDSNYPELQGFIYNQTIQGANDYIKAIHYYSQ